MTDPTGADRAAAIERARALMAERGSGPQPESSSPSGRSRGDAHPATASRIMTAGVAASAGMMLVAAMAASAQAGVETPSTPQPPQIVHRVVTIEIPSPVVAPAASAAPEATQVREVAALPAPADDPAPAPAESEGS